MRRRNSGKVILYCAIAFCVTCIVGTLGLLAYTSYVNGVPLREVFSFSAQEEHGDEDMPMADASDAQGSDVLPVGDEEAQTDVKAGAETSRADAKADGDADEALAADDGQAEGADQTGAGDEPLPEIVTDAPREATLVFGGDICFYDPFSNMTAYRERGSDIKNCISAYLLGEMCEADICMVNNEFAYSDRGAPLERKAYTFRSKPQNVEILHDMGVDIVSVANNHAYDYGRDAFVDTLQTLDDAGVKHVGGGRDLEEASEPVYLEAGGLTIGFVSATQIERLDSPDTRGATEGSPGVLRCFNKNELAHFLDVVQKAKANCDFLVAYVHWGTENTDVLDWAQPYQAEQIGAAGADLIVGCHPHCLQGLGVTNNVPVIYSLGNYWFNSKTVDTALLKVRVNENGLESLQMIAAKQSGCSTNELTGSEQSRVLGYLQSLSPDVTIDGEGFISWW